MNWPTKKHWLDWHTLMGVSCGLLLFVICWSGTFATVSLELDWLLTPALRSTVKEIDNQDMVQAYERVHQAMPEAQIQRIEQLAPSGYALTVQVRRPQLPPEFVLFDPATGTITGTTSFINVSRFFRDFHMYLFGFFGVGKYVVCLFALGLLTSLTTGLMFYKKWWRRFFQRPSQKGKRAFWSSLHRLLGVWSVWFLLVMGVTGTWYLFEQSRLDLLDGRFSYTDSVRGAVHALPKISPKPETSSVDLTAAVEHALQAIPELRIRDISLNRGGYVFISGQTESILVRDRANKVYLVPDTAEVAYRQRAEDLSAYWRWSNMADPIHFGDFAGWISKTLWVVFGLILCFLSLSGTWMFVQRTATKSQASHTTSLRLAIYVSLAVIVLTLVMAGLNILLVSPMIDGVRHFPNIPLATASFLLGWIVLTVAFCLGWGGWVLKRIGDRRGA